MLARLTLLTLAMIAVAGAANAQSMTSSLPSTAGRGPHKVAITDEYGFHYDSAGNRLNSAGYVVAPPHTLPGAAVIQNGRGGA